MMCVLGLVVHSSSTLTCRQSKTFNAKLYWKLAKVGLPVVKTAVA